MTILDEDTPEEQYQLLRRWRLAARRIGVDVGRLGMKDREKFAKVKKYVEKHLAAK